MPGCATTDVWYGTIRRSPSCPSMGWRDGDVVPNPISFKDYLRKLLKRGFWGEDVVLYALSVIYDIRITVLNVHTPDEYRYRHNKPIAQADIVLIFTGSNHYLYAGK